MKKRKMLRLSALLLSLLMLVLCVSCAAGSEEGEKIPEGMQAATADGALYRLYIPTSWTVNTAFGTSGGYYSLGRQSTVSVSEYPLTEDMEAVLGAPYETTAGEAEKKAGEVRAERFYQGYLRSHIASLATGEVTAVDVNSVALVWGGLNAYQYHCKATVDGVLLHFLHVIGEKDGIFYVLAFTVDDSLYEGLNDDGHIASIRDSFKFAKTPYEAPENGLVADGATPPEGMQTVSSKDVEYIFFAPADWSVDRTQRICAATAPDGSVVSVVPYMPSAEDVEDSEDGGMGISEYFARNVKMLEQTAGGKVKMRNGDGVKITLDEQHEAMCYEYTYTLGGVTYSYMQVITIHGNMFYNITYTALSEHYAANLADVQSMLDAFRFR